MKIHTGENESIHTVLFKNSKRYTENKFGNEKNFEELVFNSSKMLFGENTVLIDVKKKIGTQLILKILKVLG
ncbi:MAG TPA: hypothetical protein VMZ04_05115 [Anaerolineae bacterium]|nr:hypothetical protein [Anaerolineae bacterium]